jgi:hypothetical protein
MHAGPNPNQLRFAIVETRSVSAAPERMVIAYLTERSLREFFAAPRILASGYCSREQAAVQCRRLQQAGHIHGLTQLRSAVAGRQLAAFVRRVVRLMPLWVVARKPSSHSGAVSTTNATMENPVAAVFSTPNILSPNTAKNW